MVEIIKKWELESFEEDDSTELPPPEIVAYNESRSCADLFRMYTDGILEIQPSFQREIVWKEPQQTRFIDSLVKQLPIPSMCFSLDYKTQKWQVIDGLQRMWSIIRFLSGQKWTLSKLEDIDQKLSGQQIEKFTDRNSDLNIYLKRVQNLTLPVTVLRCDYSKNSHMNYLFMIFHRLNTGGEKLNNQEIRNCIYNGKFNQLLKSLNNNPSWQRINRMKDAKGYRFIKEELILRFFALNDRYKEYQGRLARFLNDYMNENKNPDDEFIADKAKLFNRTIRLVDTDIFEGRAPQDVTVAILEGTLVGISLNLHYVESLSGSRIKNLYGKLRSNPEYSEERLKEGLAGKTRVLARMDAANAIFSGH
jgi:hypothetical protein